MLAPAVEIVEEKNRNICLVKSGRGMGLLDENRGFVEAAGGFEPPHGGKKRNDAKR
jgi:hypothetical protein